MGIIPWLIMMRLRNKQAQRQEAERNKKKGDDPDELRLRMGDWMSRYSQSSAKPAPSYGNPLDSARGIFD